jgi:hypothetical protein
MQDLAAGRAGGQPDGSGGREEWRGPTENSMGKNSVTTLTCDVVVLLAFRRYGIR